MATTGIITPPVIATAACAAVIPTIVIGATGAAVIPALSTVIASGNERCVLLLPREMCTLLGRRHSIPRGGIASVVLRFELEPRLIHNIRIGLFHRLSEFLGSLFTSSSTRHV
jgi:hypothetical protein